MRIQKFLSQAGILSRRKAEEALLKGRIRINGVVVTEAGTTLDPSKDQVELDEQIVGATLSGAVRTTYAYHKPRGVVTTKVDPEGRPTVMDAFADAPGLFPVGRLDLDSEGLLFMTDDGEFALTCTHPRYEIEKEYEVHFEGVIEHERSIAAWLKGIELEEGGGKFLSAEFSAPDTCRVVVAEGRKRFVRRMFMARGARVLRLKRLRIGPFRPGDLAIGERLLLDPKEVSEWTMKSKIVNAARD